MPAPAGRNSDHWVSERSSWPGCSASARRGCCCSSQSAVVVVVAGITLPCSSLLEDGLRRVIVQVRFRSVEMLTGFLQQLSHEVGVVLCAQVAAAQTPAVLVAA